MASGPWAVWRANGRQLRVRITDRPHRHSSISRNGKLAGTKHETARRPPKPATRFRHARDTKRRQTTISPAKRNHRADLGRCTISKEVDKRRKRPGIGLLIRRFRVRFPGDPRLTRSFAMTSMIVCCSLTRKCRATLTRNLRPSPHRAYPEYAFGLVNALLVAGIAR